MRLMGTFNGWRLRTPKPVPSTASGALTVPDLLDARADARSDHAPLCLPSGARLTYGEWRARSGSVALDLYQNGLRVGARVALIFDGLDWLDYAVAYMAVLRCGATAVHMNGHMPDAEIQRRLAECDCSTLIRSRFVAPPRGFSGRHFTIDELLRGDESLSSIPIAPDSIAEIRYTSGTTGAAKGYLVSHDNLTFGRTLDSMQELSGASGMLVPMTLGTSTSATLLVIALTSPAPMLLCSPLDIESMGELIARERITAFMVTPRVAQEVIEARLGERHDLGSIRLVASASSPLSPSMAASMLAMMPNATLQIACAQSEASPALLTHTYTQDRPFSVGRPSPATEIRVVGPDLSEAADGELGELWLRTAAPKRLFLTAPEVNALLRKDGWYRTGDLVRRDASGEIEFFDRKADALMRDGQLISSIHMEATLMNDANVREAAVVSVDRDAEPAQIIAFVALRDPNALSAVKGSLSNAIPPAQFPDAFVVVSALPRTQNGKVLKRDLRLNVGIR
ncbi:long-chain fatty acid--CoA ligase [Verminephrobacter aporrectodeae subsp. tuberculatae]|uniref:Long-chain fatty acid--CoA ligase n=2 Tax=Verminephrobacter TaxID=364316 RepID=A0ABT3KVV6_9BURK|nr:long-chain fatty acid--CoA ligase [Verminephrobacter aporrectodeae subsp. tuberculatae]MCW8199655.1 long-chain fatty acid--CoA ligase [Verminephrobacter aporrectodeae subsp. tuberculatae]